MSIAKFFIILVCLIGCVCPAFAQNQVTIQGKVKFTDKDFKVSVYQRIGREKKVLAETLVNDDNTYSVTVQFDKPGMAIVDCGRWQSVNIWLDDENMDIDFRGVDTAKVKIKNPPYVYIRAGKKNEVMNLVNFAEYRTYQSMIAVSQNVWKAQIEDKKSKQELSSSLYEANIDNRSAWMHYIVENYADVPSVLVPLALLDEEKDTIDIERVKEAIDKNDKNFINEVSVSDVRERDYEWYVPNYMDYVKQVPAGYRKILLSKLLEPLEETDGSALIGCVVREDYLVSNPFEEYVQNPKPFKSSFISNLCEDKKDDDDDDGEDDESDKYYSYKGTPFVVQYGEKELKTYYHEFELGLFREVNVPKSCHAYRINTDLIDINYLRLRLAQIDKESNGELRRNGIKRWEGGKGINPALLIPLSLEEQRHIYEDAKLNEAVEKARKEGLDKAIDSMKQEYMMEVRMRKHDMKPFLSQLDSQAKLITFYLDKIEGNDDVVSAIRQKLTGISNAVSELRLHLNRLTEEDIYGTPEVVNPLDILNELTGTFSNYSVALEIDTVALKEAQIDSPEIFISKVDFSTLATTIIENAVSHAFIGESKDYKVLITLSYNAVKDVFTIDFKNNGNPMPQGMDKFRYGLKGEKGAKSHGTGLGGYRVKSITRHYDGDYDVFCNRIQNTTTIRVIFPKYNAHE